MSYQQPQDTQSPILMTKQDFLSHSKDSYDSLIAIFALQNSDLVQTRTIDKDFLKLSESVMKQVWDNPYDDVWDSA